MSGNRRFCTSVVVIIAAVIGLMVSAFVFDLVSGGIVAPPSSGGSSTSGSVYSPAYSAEAVQRREEQEEKARELVDRFEYMDEVAAEMEESMDTE